MEKPKEYFKSVLDGIEMENEVMDEITEETKERGNHK